jgi:ribosome biogenesis GTPase
MGEKDRIISSVAGDYTVRRAGGEIITCKARGLFRLKNISPCTGDYVTLEHENNQPVIAQIHERVNFLVRPPLANLDCAVLVIASCEPKPSTLVIDNLTVIFDRKEIETVLVFTKLDKKKAALLEVYREAGFLCFERDNLSGIAGYLSGKTSALIGNTGVGKTSLINDLIPGLNLPTAEISKKLGRGKHTTRTVELHSLPGGGYCADTPGFSTVETRAYTEIPPREIAQHFREFLPFLGKCRFGGCTHSGEDGCAVTGNIADSRYESYKMIYGQAKKSENSY